MRNLAKKARASCQTNGQTMRSCSIAKPQLISARISISSVGQQEGLVYADALAPQSIELIHKYAKNQRADVEDGCPKDILVQSRSEFVDGEFWTAVQAGAVIVCFNAPFDLSRLALEYREARNKNSGWSMVLWRYQGKPDKFKPKSEE